MSTLEAILKLLDELKEALNRKEEKDAKLVNAVSSIQLAIIETREFYKMHGSTTNTKLSKLWLDAFEKTKNANILSAENFAISLYQKARFWGDTDSWIKLDSAMELVPLLNDIDEECNSLLERLK